jgi:hypothetical protein
VFVTQDDFKLIPYAIANLGENGETLDALIPGIEKKILVDTLGLLLYNEFILGLEQLPEVWDNATDYLVDDEAYQGVTIWRALQPNTNIVPAEGAYWTKVEDNKWLKLRDGFSYTYCSKLYMYEGIKSFIKPLVVFQWLKDFVFDAQTDAGVVASEVENAGNNGPRNRMVAMWNESSRAIGNNREGRNTLWGYLYTTYQTDYTDLDFSEMKRINEFDL